MSRTTLITIVIAATGLGLAASCTRNEQPAPPAAPPAVAHEMPGMTHAQPGPAGAAKAPAVFSAPQPVGTAARCPVTGEPLTVQADTARSEYQGKYVYFCCPGCKPQFDADPEKFLAAAQAGGATP